MEQVVYVDVLFATNLIINYLMLLSVSKLLRHNAKKIRVFLGALSGALYSLVIFFPIISFTYSALMKFIFSMFIVVVTFGFMKERRFALTLIAFYAINFSFAGIMFALWLFFAPNGLLINNGVVYFDISPLMLIFLSVLSYMLIKLYNMLFLHNASEKATYDLTISVEGKSATLKGLLDTGNTLTDIFSEEPVIVVQWDYIKRIIPKSLEATFSAMLNNDTVSHDFSTDKWGTRFRVIPFNSVGGFGLLPAFKPDKIFLKNKDKFYEINDVYIAVCKDKLANGEFGALINPDTLRFKQKEKRRGGVVEKTV